MIRNVCLLVVLAFLVGCSRDVLNRESAAKKISRKLSSNERQLFVGIGRVGTLCRITYPPGGESKEMNADPTEDLGDLVAERAGYITVAPDGKNYWKVNLTDKGEAFLRKYPGQEVPSDKSNGCDFRYVDFHVATPSLVEVTGITTGDNVRDVDYSWKWVPTELGMALEEGGELYSRLTPAERRQVEGGLNVGTNGPKLPVPLPPPDKLQQTTSRFKKFDDGWRLQ